MKKNNSGTILIQTLIFSTIAVMFISGLVAWASLNLKAMKQSASSEVAMHIAEAGIDYYRWHLAHAPQDFKDGTGNNGPYVHVFKDKNGGTIGNFSLVIVPPPVGSTVVTIRSTGTSSTTPSKSRTIETKLAIPSWAKYAIACNDDIRIGEGTEVFGPVHSNRGIRFDGLAHNLITSSLASYNDPDHGGQPEHAVHTHVFPIDPNPPVAWNTRSDVFMSGRQVSVPAVDFNGITSNLADLKAKAQAGGKYFANSGDDGYHVVLKVNNTFDLYKVTSVKAPLNKCNNGQGQASWSTWTIKTQVFLANHQIPANGIVFLDDNVWVDGKINNSRITIGAGHFPDNAATRRMIIVNNDLLYTNYEGTDSIGLIAQNGVTVGLESEDNLRIDAALVAQNGRVGRFYYDDSKCGVESVRDTITLFGIIVSNARYGFAYTNGTGYQTRNIIYDANMLYAPPPSFPLVSSQYEIVSWKEI